MPCPVSPTKLPVDPEKNLLQLFLENSEELTTSRTYGFITECIYIGEVKLLRVAENFTTD